METKMWFLIESEEEYREALQRYETIKYAEHIFGVFTPKSQILDPS